MPDPRRKLEWSDRWMPLVHFPVGAGGADGRHGNVQPCDYMHLCPLSMAVDSSNVGVLRVTLAQLHCVSLNKATRKKNHNLTTSCCIEDTNICGNSDTDAATKKKLQNNGVVHYFFF